MKPISPSVRQSGFSLLEALVTMLILAFGLLGVAGLQAKVQVSESEAFARTQAILLVEDMSNRISANRVAASTYVTGTTPLGTGDGQPASCAGLTALALDQCEWSQTLNGTSEQKSGSKIGAMVGARGCIDKVGTNPDAYRVTVVWQGATRLKAPSVDCGKGLYGAEGNRRALSNVVTIANLSAP